MKLALTTSASEIQYGVPIAMLEGGLRRRMDAAADLGYDGVELLVANPGDLDAHTVRAEAFRRGLEIAAISSGAQASIEHLTLLAADTQAQLRARQRLQDLILFAAQVDAPLVTIGSFRGRAPQHGLSAAYDQLVEILSSAAVYAARHGIRLAIEPLNRYEAELIHTADEALGLIAAANQPNIGVLLDTYHMNIEEASLTACIHRAQTSGRLWHMHIGDSNRLPPGLGHFDFPQVFNALKSLGYQGFISAELLSQPDPQAAAATVMEYCRPWLNRR